MWLEKFHLEVGKEQSIVLRAGYSRKKNKVEKVSSVSGWRVGVAENLLVEIRSRSRRTKANGMVATYLVSEEDGVRLALVYDGLGSIKDVSRAYGFVSGIREMSREEAFYWFAKTQNGSAKRGIRALRVLLAGVR